MFIDILLLVIITFSIIICFKKGIVLSVFNILSAVASVILLAIFYNPSVEAFKNSFLGIKLTEGVQKRVSDMFLESGNTAIQSSDMPEFVKEFLYSGTDTITQSITNLTDKIIGIIIGIVVFILLVLIIKLIVKFVPKILDAVTSLPILRQANKLLGGIAGVAVGIIWSFLAVYIVGLLSLVPALEFLDEQIGQSLFISVLHTLKIGEFLF